VPKRPAESIWTLLVLRILIAVLVAAALVVAVCEKLLPA
jgi:hypothetical protein